jgi:hypothetical protein
MRARWERGIGPHRYHNVPSERSAGKQRLTARQRLAAEQAAVAEAQLDAARRRRMVLGAGAPLVLVVAVVAVLVIVKVATGAGGPKSGPTASLAASSVVTQVTAVPASALNEIGVGVATTKPTKITAPALTADGEPRVVYVGAEYCPYCATERWAMAVALSRFGTFTGLGETASSPSDVYPNTATLTFHGASYASNYLSFTGREIQSNQVVNGEYAPLDTLSAADQALFAKYDAPPYTDSAGSIPFIDIGGRYVISGASYSPQVLQGKTQTQIAAALSDPNSAIAKAVDGTANLITAAICQITNGQPATVCQSPGVTTATAALTG